VQRVLSKKDLWTEVRKKARASNTRNAAIAYVTRDLVGFRNGDTLVIDASILAIKNGETDAPPLRKLHKEDRLQIAAIRRASSAYRSRCKAFRARRRNRF
jgi:hypothetical protein